MHKASAASGWTACVHAQARHPCSGPDVRLAAVQHSVGAGRLLTQACSCRCRARLSLQAPAEPGTCTPFASSFSVCELLGSQRSRSEQRSRVVWRPDASFHRLCAACSRPAWNAMQACGGADESAAAGQALGSERLSGAAHATPATWSHPCAVRSVQQTSLEADQRKRAAGLVRAQLQVNVEDSELPGAGRPLLAPQPLPGGLPASLSAGKTTASLDICLLVCLHTCPAEQMAGLARSSTPNAGLCLAGGGQASAGAPPAARGPASQPERRQASHCVLTSGVWHLMRQHPGAAFPSMADCRPLHSAPQYPATGFRCRQLARAGCCAGLLEVWQRVATFAAPPSMWHCHSTGSCHTLAAAQACWRCGRQWPPLQRPWTWRSRPAWQRWLQTCTPARPAQVMPPAPPWRSA